MNLDRLLTQCPTCGRPAQTSGSTIQVPIKGRYAELCEDRVIEYALCPCGLYYAKKYFTDELAFYQEGDYRRGTSGSPGASHMVVTHDKIHGARLEDFISNKLAKVDNALDVGCSTGQILSSLKRHYGCRITGVEPNQYIRAYLKEKGIACEASLSDLRETYDLVVLSHVLEHTTDPIALLSGIRDRLSGLLLIQVPFVMPDLAHPLLFTESSLAWTLRAAGLKVVEAIPGRDITFWVSA